jgi:phage/plasmid-like protein (TIGR03299 family)
MAHEIEVVDGVAKMAYAGEVPWHGLGTRVGEDLSPLEIMGVAGLDWSVEKRDVFYVDAKNEYSRATKKQALVRSSDGAYLDIVSDDWVPVQNIDALTFFDEYVAAGGMSMHTAGSLKDGKIIWALAKVNESFDLFGGNDVVDSYLLLSNPHQFGRGVDVRFTPVRVVCNNTLSLSLEGKAALGISMNHRAEFDAERVKEALNEAHDKMEKYKEMATFLTEKRYTQESLFEYFARVFPKTSGETIENFSETLSRWVSEAGSVKTLSRNAATALETIDIQPGAEYGEGTWWQAYNTVTFMTNHVVGRSTDTRMQSTWFGSNRNKNVEALGMALDFAMAA